jgi:hypothetical protein
MSRDKIWDAQPVSYANVLQWCFSQRFFETKLQQQGVGLGLLHCLCHRMVAFDVAQLMKLVDVQFMLGIMIFSCNSFLYTHS